VDGAPVPSHLPGSLDRSHRKGRILELEGDDYVERAFVVGEEPVAVALPFPVTLVPARLVEV